MKKQLLYIICILGLFSCGETKSSDNPNMLYPSPCGINVISNRQILKDSEACFKIAPAMENFRILEAYVGCGKKNIREYEATDKKIKDCIRRLVIVRDSVKILFSPDKLGKQKFEDITLLIQDNNKNMYFIDTTFYFNVEAVK